MPNPFLSSILGAEGPSAEDLIKAAAAETLEGLAEANGVDLSSLSDDEVAALLDEVANGEAGAEDEGEYTYEQIKEAQFQGEVADAAGRLMAQSFYDELQKTAQPSALDQLAHMRAQEILKEAGISDDEPEGLTVEDVAAYAAEQGIDPQEMSDDDFEFMADFMEKEAMIKQAGGSLPNWAYKSRRAGEEFVGKMIGRHGIEKGPFGRTRAGGSAEDWLKGYGAKATEGIKAKLRSGTKGRYERASGAWNKRVMRAQGPANRHGTAPSSKMTGGQRALSKAKAVGMVAPEITGAGLTAGIGAHALRKKEASALENTVEERAYELLKEAGYIE